MFSFNLMTTLKPVRTIAWACLIAIQRTSHLNCSRDKSLSVSSCYLSSARTRSHRHKFIPLICLNRLSVPFAKWNDSVECVCYPKRITNQREGLGQVPCFILSLSPRPPPPIKKEPALFSEVSKCLSFLTYLRPRTYDKYHSILIWAVFNIRVSEP